jgi:hypothetical protein
LFLSGQVDDRTIQKYEKEAKDKSRESWWVGCEQYLACTSVFARPTHAFWTWKFVHTIS